MGYTKIAMFAAAIFAAGLTAALGYQHFLEENSLVAELSRGERG